VGFQVFIERAKDPSPGGLELVARNLAQRYSFPQQLILDRLRAGRFPAWSNLDYETARRCSSELESFGLIVTVVDEAAPAAPPKPATRPPAPPIAAPVAAAPKPAAAPVYTSGLAAAAGGGGGQELGALADVDSWQIAAIDGSVEEAPPPLRSSAAPSGAAAHADAVEEDPFAPPASEREEVELEIPVEQLATTSNAAAQQLAAPPPVASIEPDAPPPSADPLPARVVAAIGEGRGNLIAGVAVALLLGFLPAHMVGCQREKGYDEIRESVAAEIALIDSPEAWDNAAVAQAAGQATIESRHSSIVVSSVGLWLLAFGGLLYVWLRVIDWDRLAWLAGARRPPRH
jgi:hypothetical protein